MGKVEEEHLASLGRTMRRMSDRYVDDAGYRASLAARSQPKSPKRTTRNEADEQRDLCKWLRMRQLPFFAVPNHLAPSMRGLCDDCKPVVKKNAAIHIHNEKSKGMKSGVSDIVVLLPGGRAVFVEMKNEKDGALSKNQREFIADATRLGYPARSCAGVQEAIRFVEEVIG